MSICIKSSAKKCVDGFTAYILTSRECIFEIMQDEIKQNKF